MFKKFPLYLSAFILVIFPFVTQAQVCSQKNLACVINIIIGYLNQFLVLMIGLAVVIFVWYIIQYFIKPNEDRKNASLYVMYSLIGFFVILSFWGLVNILQNTFGLKNENNQPASWTSFKGLFPAGGNTSGNPSSVTPGTVNTGTPRGVAPGVSGNASSVTTPNNANPNSSRDPSF